MIPLTASLIGTIPIVRTPFKTPLTVSLSLLLSLYALPILSLKTPISPFLLTDALNTPLILLTLWLLPLIILASPKSKTKIYPYFLLTLILLTTTLVLAFAAP